MNQKQTEVHDESAAVVVYANHVSIEASNFDVKFRMGLRQQSQPDEVRVKDTAHVYMSHEHFRAFVGILQTILSSMDQSSRPSVPAARPFLTQ